MQKHPLVTLRQTRCLSAMHSTTSSKTFNVLGFCGCCILVEFYLALAKPIIFLLVQKRMACTFSEQERSQLCLQLNQLITFLGDLELQSETKKSIYQSLSPQSFPCSAALCKGVDFQRSSCPPNLLVNALTCGHIYEAVLHQLHSSPTPGHPIFGEKNRCNRENRSTANCESCFPECTWSHHKIHEYAWDNTLHPLLSILHPCRRVSAGDAKHLKLKRSNANTHYLSTNMNPKTNQETPWPNCCAHQQLCAKVLQDVCPDTIFDSLREARLTSQGVPAKSTMPPLNWTNSILKNVLRVDVCSITQKQCCQGSIPHGEIG